MADTDPDFASLPPDTQREVTNAVQRLKTEFFDIMNGIRGPKSTGATTIGILPMLPTDDPIAVKLNKVTKEISQLFDYLDKGPPADKKPVPIPQSGDMPGGGPMGAAPAKPNPNALKVNLAQIRDKLQEVSTALDGIISG
jgi:hypothetical protein